MTYERFEDLPYWQGAMNFAVTSLEVLDDCSFNGCGDAGNQLQRTSLI